MARTLAGIGLNVPIVLARDELQGFLLLSDLGTRQYLEELKTAHAVDRLYADALSALVTLQTAGDAAARQLPPYDGPLLLRELELFPEWFLRQHLGMAIGPRERAMLDALFVSLNDAALSQPDGVRASRITTRAISCCATKAIRAFWISRMRCVGRSPTMRYRCSRIATSPGPAARVRSWLLGYRDNLAAAGFALSGTAADFVRWFDLMGLQRHIKVLGIFARLYYRDGKSGYLKDLPRVLDYTRATAAAYPETAAFAAFVAAHIDPAFAAAQARAGA